MAGRKEFPAGEVVLEVEHQPDQLVVWRQGRRDDVVVVHVEEDYSIFTVAPYYGNTDMPVQFTGKYSTALV